MELVVISNPVLIPNEAQIINDLFNSGLKYFHLRKPLYTANQTRQLIEQIAPENYAAIALHHHHDIAHEFGIKRLHYTESARNGSNIKQWQKQVHDGYVLSTSIHDLAVLPALKLFSYIFFGPVFNSISKQGYTGVVQNDFCLGEKLLSKVIALGGIDAHNIAITKQMNFDGAAVLGALWNDPEKAIENFKQIKECINKL